jgi:pimeloyl-ACP methyl ester carboxylesterase
VRGWELRESFETEAGSVRFDRFGDGPPLVMVHGTPFSSVVWRDLVSRLRGEWTIFVWDLLGYGASDQRAGQDVSIAAQTRIFGRLLDHWRIDSPVVVAHDIGGAIALRTHLLDDREYQALALIDPVALAPWGSPFFRLVQEHTDVFERIPPYIHEAMVAAYIRNASHVPLADDVLEALSRPWLGDQGQPAFYRQIAQADQRFTDEVQPRYGGIRCPVLIGSARVIVLPAAGHLVQEDAPEETAVHLSRFLLDQRRSLPDSAQPSAP